MDGPLVVLARTLKLVKISKKKLPKYFQMDNFIDTVRPPDTRPQTAWTSQVHVFELGPKILEMHVFARFCRFLQVFARFFDK